MKNPRKPGTPERMLEDLKKRQMHYTQCKGGPLALKEKEIAKWPVVIPYQGTTTEEPVKLPVGRIDYLHTNGSVRERIEFIRPQQFESEIQEQSYYGVPMQVVLYADKHGKTVAYPATPCRVSVIPNPYLERTFLDLAKGYIEDYYRDEFGKDNDRHIDFDNLHAVPVAYTTTEDDKHEIQAYVDLIDLKVITQVDGKAMRIEQYPSLWDMSQAGLRYMTFDDLTYVPEEYLQTVAV